MKNKPETSTHLQHPWNLSPTEAVNLQQELKEKIELSPLKEDIQLIGGADISFNLYSDIFYAGIVVLDYQSLEVVAQSLVKTKATFPYIPGLLSFREIPSLLEAWKQLKTKPNAVMVDGHGIAHPRKMGIATHFGLVTGIPTLGCAKKVLAGQFEEPGLEKGSHSPLIYKEEKLGYALRSKNKVKPVFISPGHLMSHKDALRIALHCAQKYKLPEPTRRAHLAVNEYRKEQK